MNVTVYLSLLLVTLFVALAPALARRLPPPAGAWLITLGVVAAALATNLALVLLSLPLIGQLAPIAEVGGWSSTVLEVNDPVRTPIAVAASAGLVVALLRAGRAGVNMRRARGWSRELAKSLPVGRELVVVDEPARYAFALPGRSPHIVASRGLLRALDASGRRAVLAHERAHLRHRHDLHLAIVNICAAACPVAGGLPRAARLACERWADERAAAATDRNTVANALTVTAGATRRLPTHALAIASDAVALRVLAMRAPRLHLRPQLWLPPVALLVAVVACDANAMVELHGLFEHAQAALAAR